MRVDRASDGNGDALFPDLVGGHEEQRAGVLAVGVLREVHCLSYRLHLRRELVVRVQVPVECMQMIDHCVQYKLTLLIRVHIVRVFVQADYVVGTSGAL